MFRKLAVIGAPSGAGACGVGQERAPAALRGAGLIESLGGVGFDVSDLGDLPMVPWRPDRAKPRAQNLEAVVEVVRRTAARVGDALLERERTVLVLGGDCTVGIGTVAGVRSTVNDVSVAYFDLHAGEDPIVLWHVHRGVLLEEVGQVERRRPSLSTCIA